MVNGITFEPNNTIGAMFSMYYYMPYTVFVIKLNGKEYIGTVNNIRIKDLTGSTISGEFHPHLESNYFEAFYIYPDTFEISNVIDLQASPNSFTISTIFWGGILIEKATQTNIATIRGTVPKILVQIKEAFKDFNLTHPELDTERGLYLIDECIERTNCFRIENMPLRQDEINVVMNFTIDAIKDAMRSLLVSPKF